MAGGDDELYDAYLAACSAGDVEEPAAFFARHPGAGEELRERVALLHGMLAEGAGTDLPFAALGEFRLLERLDAGGMGNVYLAEQQGLGRIVALKVIRPELRGSREATARFEREAQAIARLRHPNLVTVYGAGVEQGVHFLAMELVPGRGLDDLLARDPPPWRRAVGWAAQLARALAYAHAQGIVHRDVKPANIRITPDDRPLLLDFGVAYDMGADRTALTRTFAGRPPTPRPSRSTPAAARWTGARTSTRWA